jgi:hypothetical protein
VSHHLEPIMSERKLTQAQVKALVACRDAGLWCDGTNLWRWYCTLPNGMTFLAASNPTIATLKACGYVETVKTNRIALSRKGRLTLSKAHPAQDNAAQPLVDDEGTKL